VALAYCSTLSLFVELALLLLALLRYSRRRPTRSVGCHSCYSQQTSSLAALFSQSDRLAVVHTPQASSVSVLPLPSSLLSTAANPSSFALIAVPARLAVVAFWI
jgi:hypothetical protein